MGWNWTIVLVSLHSSDDNDSFDVGCRKHHKPVLSISHLPRAVGPASKHHGRRHTRSRFLGELIDAEWTRRRAGQ